MSISKLGILYLNNVNPLDLSFMIVAGFSNIGIYIKFIDSDIYNVLLVDPFCSQQPIFKNVPKLEDLTRTDTVKLSYSPLFINNNVNSTSILFNLISNDNKTIEDLYRDFNLTNIDNKLDNDRAIKLISFILNYYIHNDNLKLSLSSLLDGEKLILYKDHSINILTLMSDTLKGFKGFKELIIKLTSELENLLKSNEELYPINYLIKYINELRDIVGLTSSFLDIPFDFNKEIVLTKSLDELPVKFILKSKKRIILRPTETNFNNYTLEELNQINEALNVYIDENNKYNNLRLNIITEINKRS